MNPLEYIQDPLRWLLDFLHDEVNLTYGWAIVALTVIVRLVLLPLVIKQYRSMRQLQAYSPQIKEIQAKYKGNRQKQQEELMAFYRENQINPLASCLPIAAQLPVFFALYFVLRDFADSDALDGTDPSFMWVIPDISQRITEIGWTAIIVLGVYGISQLLSTELSATPQMPDIQRRIFRVLPIGIIASFFLFPTFPLPAGLVLYWATTNLWTAGQQLIMRHRIGMHLTVPENQPTGKRTSKTAPQEVAPAAVGDAAEDGPVAGADGEVAGESGAAAPAGEERAVAVEERADATEAEEGPADEEGAGSEDSSRGNGQPRDSRPKQAGAKAGGGGRKRKPRAKGAGPRQGKRRAPRRKR